MQNLITRFRKSSIISEKPGYLSENVPLTIDLIFFVTFFTGFLLNTVYKSVQDLFIFFRSWAINKYGKNLVSVSLQKPGDF